MVPWSSSPKVMGYVAMLSPCSPCRVHPKSGRVKQASRRRKRVLWEYDSEYLPLFARSFLPLACFSSRERRSKNNQAGIAVYFDFENLETRPLTAWRAAILARAFPPESGSGAYLTRNGGIRPVEHVWRQPIFSRLSNQPHRMMTLAYRVETSIPD